MIRLLASLFLALFALATPVAAHPHVFVDGKVVFILDDQDRLTALRHIWQFDEAFSVYAIQGLDENGDGTYTRAELAELAEVNVTSLRDFDYFTFLTRGADVITPLDPVDYWLDFGDDRLTLTYTMPLPAPVPLADAAVRLEVADPEFFVAFMLAEDTPAAIEGGGDACAVSVTEPAPLEGDLARRLSEIPVDGMVPPELLAQTSIFVPVVSVSCGGDALLMAEVILPSSSETLESPLDLSEDVPLEVPDLSEIETPSFFQGIVQGIAEQQANFYQRLTGALRGIAQGEGGAWLLIGLSFLYGVLHAAGPGHGKAVLASYMLATRSAARRGIVLSVLAALAQGLMALAVVAVLAGIVKATSSTISSHVLTLERLSYGVLTLFGVWLIWQKLVSPLLAQRSAAPASVGAAAVHDHHHHHHDHHDHDHAHRGDGELCSVCGHAHIPSAKAMETPLSLGQAAAVVGSIGMRPCSGAIIVLIFAIAQGQLLAGALSVLAMSLGTAITVSAIVLMAAGGRVATEKAFGAGSGRAALVHRGIEGVGALAVFGFGLLLLVASLQTRVMPF